MCHPSDRRKAAKETWRGAAENRPPSQTQPVARPQASQHPSERRHSRSGLIAGEWFKKEFQLVGIDFSANELGDSMRLPGGKWIRPRRVRIIRSNPSDTLGLSYKVGGYIAAHLHPIAAAIVTHEAMHDIHSMAPLGGWAQPPRSFCLFWDLSPPCADRAGYRLPRDRADNPIRRCFRPYRAIERAFFLSLGFWAGPALPTVCQ